jgi:hypothetical protein
MKKYLYIILLCFVCSLNISAQKMIGGDDSFFANELYDPAYPMMEEWAKAGVEGGIPSFNKVEVKKRITVTDNLQEVISSISKLGGGKILISNGDYLVKHTLNIPSNVILRGENRDSVRLLVDMHGFHFKTKKPLTAALSLNGVEKAGIENLTIKYITPNFEPVDKQHVYEPWDHKVFHERERRDTTLFVETIWINNSRNCWIDNCQILWSGSDAIRINNSEHITCRHNYIDRSYNKCDGGMGYYNIMRSKYVLCCYEKVRRIRHFAIHVESQYCVAIHNDFEVDVNFHSGDNGYNLIEDNRIIIPVWHSWHCFQRGDPQKHKPAGKWNIIYNNVTYYKLDGPEYSTPGVVYMMNDKFGGENVLIRSDLKKPLGNTFYPVKVK